MFIKILHTLFFVAISYIIFMKYNKQIKLRRGLMICLAIYLSGLFFINTYYDVISNKLLIILLSFSGSILILNIMKEFVSLENNKFSRQNIMVKNNYGSIKNIIFKKILPILILLYQILLIWFPVIFERMSER